MISAIRRILKNAWINGKSAEAEKDMFTAKMLITDGKTVKNRNAGINLTVNNIHEQ